MKIISFTGKSGTGKSYQATAVAQTRNIDAIIDDGLLIYKGQIVAGRSAKKSKSKSAAMRIALFNYEDHRNEVINALVKYHPETLMKIGTSDRMTNLIAETLGLHEPEERLYIEDFTTEDEREIAYESRFKQGEHVIPAPMGQLRRDFAGYFMNPIKLIVDKAVGNQKIKTPESTDDNDDRTVVRPQYSYFGLFSISEQVLRDIVSITAEKYADNLTVLGRMGNGKQNNMNITIDVRVAKRSDAVETCLAFQEDVLKAIENMTSFSVDSVNIRIKDVVDNVKSAQN